MADLAEPNPDLTGLDARASRAEIARTLEERYAQLNALPDSATLTDRARLQLDIADALLGLDQSKEVWPMARPAFDAFIAAEMWDEAVQACESLYQADQAESIVALGNGLWLAVTYPIDPALSVRMLEYVVDETPEQSDGAAVAAIVAHYLVDLRCEEEKRDSLSFLTTQLIAKVARRHSNVEDQDQLDFWLERLELKEPQQFLPRMAKIVDIIVNHQWWFDRNALRARLPVN